MEADTGVPKHRADALTDGVFAFALTLLVLGIAVPAIPAGQQAEEALPGLLFGFWPAVLAFAIAFLVLASFRHTCGPSGAWPGSTAGSPACS
jgi:uncharacterized membrane protein